MHDEDPLTDDEARVARDAAVTGITEVVHARLHELRGHSLETIADALVRLTVESAWEAWEDLMIPDPLPPAEHPNWPTDEHFRWCVWCAADCQWDNPQHAADCPTVTGVYTITAEHLRCPTCRVTPLGMSCQCGHEFQVGDSYVQLAVPLKQALEGMDGSAGSAEVHVDDDGEHTAMIVACLGCAAEESMKGLDDG